VTLQPISGDPATLLGLAARLKGQAARLDATARVLDSLARATPAAWDSPSGAVFGSRAAAAVPALRGIARRYAVAAAALAPLAEALREAQEQVARAVAEHEETQPAFLLWGNEMSAAEASSDPARQSLAPIYRSRMVRTGERVHAAERLHEQAWERWHEADALCAAVLSRLRGDGLADSLGYDALTATSSFTGGLADAAGTVSWVPVPVCKVLGAVELGARGLQLAADGTVRAVYGDGDWGTIGLSAAATAAGPLSRVVKKTATATKALGGSVDLGPRNVVVPRRWVVNDTIPDASIDAWRRAPMALGDRVRVAARGGLDDLLAKGVNDLPETVVAAASRPRGVRATVEWGRLRAQAQASAYARNAYLDDWAKASVNGRGAQRTYAAAVGIDQGGKALGSVADRQASPEADSGR